jgi:hypothetical protein
VRYYWVAGIPSFSAILTSSADEHFAGSVWLGPDQIAQLRSVFVEQSVRECQEYAPQLLTLPIEVRRRFLEEGGVDVQRSVIVTGYWKLT